MVCKTPFLPTHENPYIKRLQWWNHFLWWNFRQSFFIKFFFHKFHENYESLKYTFNSGIKPSSFKWTKTIRHQLPLYWLPKKVESKSFPCYFAVLKTCCESPCFHNILTHCLSGKNQSRTKSFFALSKVWNRHQISLVTLTLFMPISYFYTPRKRQKTLFFW